MINRDQVAELLSDVQRAGSSAVTKLEAIYGAADDQAKAILARHPDLRVKLHGCVEARIRSDQETNDFRTLVHKIRDELMPPDTKAPSPKYDDADDKSERG